MKEPFRELKYLGFLGGGGTISRGDTITARVSFTLQREVPQVLDFPGFPRWGTISSGGILSGGVCVGGVALKH